MILIAEMGATKGDWALLGEDVLLEFQTRGYSPLQGDERQVLNLLEKVSYAVEGAIPQQLHYYGTGVLDDLTAKALTSAFEKKFPAARQSFHSDLMAVAHACCGESPGIVAILGTGSNAGWYDGRQIHREIPALGYLLGDEGSGFAIGRRLLRDLLLGKLDHEVENLIAQEFGMAKEEIIGAIYRQEDPRAGIAGFAHFVVKHRDNPKMAELLKTEFMQFIILYLAHYRGKGAVHFGGSIAFRAKDLLSQLLLENDFEPGRIFARPMKGLIAFYQKKYFGK